MPALRAAQERYGWLSPDAFREVAEALDLTPAYCKGIATFYDMYHLEPIGRHTVEVCTNLACALVGAQRIVEAFEHELGAAAGETTEDRAVTFRTIECAGGMRLRTGGGHRQVVTARAGHTPDDVTGIVDELRAQGWTSSSRHADERYLHADSTEIPRGPGGYDALATAQGDGLGGLIEAAHDVGVAAAAGARASPRGARRRSSDPQRRAPVVPRRETPDESRAGRVQGPRAVWAATRTC
jgi:hypothetical protein